MHGQLFVPQKIHYNTSNYDDGRQSLYIVDNLSIDSSNICFITIHQLHLDNYDDNLQRQQQQYSMLFWMLGLVPDETEFVVQFFREGLCCLKDWHLGPSAWYDPNVTNATLKFLFFPVAKYVPVFAADHPLCQIYPIEFMIACLQCYPVVSEIHAGVVLIVNGRKRLQQIEYMLLQQPIRKISLPTNTITTTTVVDPKKKTTTTTNEDDIIDSSRIAETYVLNKLRQDGYEAMRHAMVGLQLVFMGIGWAWLVAHSLHITDTNWTGGLTGLIHAHTTMLLALAILLYYMMVDGLQKLQSAQVLEEVLDKYEDENHFKLALKDQATLCQLLDHGLVQQQWQPTWCRNDEDETNSQLPQKDNASILWQEDIDIVQANVDLLHDDFFCEDNTVVRQQLQEEWKEKAAMSRLEGCRDFVFFGLNLVAHYGYTIGILTFYWDKEDDTEPTWLKVVKLYQGHHYADWCGNFIGDLMWTIEPLVALLSPYLFRRILEQQTRHQLPREKEKED